MKIITRDGLPTWQQELLLQATFLQGQKTINAWNEWKSKVDLNGHLDPGSFRLLPQLYHNLKNQGIRDPLMMKFKGVSRQNWYTNQLFFHQVSDTLRFLIEAHIKILVIGGATLALQYYPDYQLQPEGEFAALVHPNQAVRAIEILRRLGWVSVPDLPGQEMEKWIAKTAYCQLFQNAGKNRIRLYWHLLPESRQTCADNDYWYWAVPAMIRDVPIYTLHPDEQLLQFCVQEDFPCLSQLFSRSADAMMLLNAASSEINWTRVIKQAEKRYLLLPLADTLSYLQAKLDPPLPPTILHTIRGMLSYRKELIEYNLKNSRSEALSKFSQLWFNHLRSGCSTGCLTEISGFPVFLQQRWKLNHVWHVPLYAFFKIMRRICRRLKDRVRLLIDAASLAKRRMN